MFRNFFILFKVMLASGELKKYTYFTSKIKESKSYLGAECEIYIRVWKTNLNKFSVKIQ